MSTSNLAGMSKEYLAGFREYARQRGWLEEKGPATKANSGSIDDVVADSGRKTTHSERTDTNSSGYKR